MSSHWGMQPSNSAIRCCHPLNTLWHNCNSMTVNNKCRVLISLVKASFCLEKNLDGWSVTKLFLSLWRVWLVRLYAIVVFKKDIYLMVVRHVPQKISTYTLRIFVHSLNFGQWRGLTGQNIKFNLLLIFLLPQCNAKPLYASNLPSPPHPGNTPTVKKQEFTLFPPVLPLPPFPPFLILQEIKGDGERVKHYVEKEMKEGGIN